MSGTLTPRLSFASLFVCLAALMVGEQLAHAGRANGPNRNAQSGIQGQILVLMLVSFPFEEHQRTRFELVPAAINLGIYSETGRLVRRIRSEADGTFDVNLNPGRYVIVPDVPSVLDPISIQVHPNRFTPLSLFGSPSPFWWGLISNGTVLQGYVWSVTSYRGP